MAVSGRSLIEIVQGLLERTYDIEPGLDVSRFIIGDDGYRRFYGLEVLRQTVEAGGHTARTLVRETLEGVRASLYLPDELVRTLEVVPPQRGLCNANVDAFATLTEELDHLLLISARARTGRDLSMFELELHANVSKYLVLSRFLAAGSRVLRDRQRLWLHHHLFDKAEYCDRDPRVRARYRDAARWAVRFLDRIRRLRAERRLCTLRHFHSASATGKVELINALAA